MQQLLALAFVARSRAPALASYETYAWRLNRTRVALVAARVSGRYLERLSHGRRPDTPLQLRLLVSDEYDLQQERGRREAVRMMVGVFRAIRHQLVAASSNGSANGA